MTAIAPDLRDELREIARSLEQIRSEDANKPPYRLQIVGPRHNVDIAVSPEAIQQIVHLLTQDHEAAVGAYHKEEITTQEAANLLGVSRPYFIKLLDAGKISYRRVGHFRRIRREDVEQFEREDQARRQAGLEELAAFTQEIGLDY